MDQSSDHSAQAIQVFDLLRELVANNPVEWQKVSADQQNSFGLLIRIGAIEATFQTVVALNGDNQRIRLTGKVSGDYSQAKSASLSKIISQRLGETNRAPSPLASNR